MHATVCDIHCIEVKMKCFWFYFVKIILQTSCCVNVGSGVPIPHVLSCCWLCRVPPAASIADVVANCCCIVSGMCAQDTAGSLLMRQTSMMLLGSFLCSIRRLHMSPFLLLPKLLLTFNDQRIFLLLLVSLLLLASLLFLCRRPCRFRRSC
jgi:hypothetical protein